MHAADSRLSPRIFHAADIKPTICEPRACQKSLSQHCAWRQLPHTSILGCFGIRSAPPHTSERRLRGVYHVLAVISAAVARICTRGLIVIAGAYATTTCDFLRRARMNSRESSIRTRLLGPNRWNQSPRAWACVSCVSEDVLPATDQHLYGFEGNGNAVEKRPHHRDFLSAGAHKWWDGSVPGRS